MSLAVSGYIRQFYKGYLYGAAEDERKGYDVRSLITADRQAVRCALKELRSFDYDIKDEDKTEDESNELYRKVQAYVSTYNNYIDSAHRLGDGDVERTLSQLKKMSGKSREDFEVIGIKIQNNGKLKIDKEILEKASYRKISRVFSSESDYGMQAEKYMKRIQTLVRRKNLGMPMQTQKETTKNAAQIKEDAQLAQKLAEVLDGRLVNQSI